MKQSGLLARQKAERQELLNAGMRIEKQFMMDTLQMALHQLGWGYKRINDLFLLSQDIWAESTCKSENMLQMCFNETGIELREE